MNLMTTSRATKVRCAIYTRKSSEEGLEQEFNSLHAQRDACAAYIRSQAHENWRAVPDIFDDGGHSGGTMERPGLKLLLEAVKARRIDVIVIYKIDRLTRSLADFARLAELFDAHGVSFVSVTQQFNTTTSMGRLMLNVLLSFAQFEREITAERIRDKIAASKKKGMWMGGTVPIGYDVRDRALHINPEGAQAVRTIFRLYLECGTVTALEQTLLDRKISTKERQFANGRKAGARPFSRGHLYRLLSSPIYAGRVPHRKTSFPGLHEAIIDPETWKRVQEQLAFNTNGPRRRRSRGVAEPGMLAGLVVDAEGRRFTMAHASKKGCRYHYYLGPKQASDIPESARQMRIPAPELEKVVCQELLGFLSDSTKVAEAAKARSAGEMQLLIERLKTEGENQPDNRIRRVLPSLTRVVARDDRIQLEISRMHLRRLMMLPEMDQDRDELSTFTLDSPASLYTSGRRIKLVLRGSGQPVVSSEPDPTLLRTLIKALRWFELLRTGEADSIASIASSELVGGGYVTRVLRLAFLSPVLIERILNGTQSPSLTADGLTLRTDIPLDWTGQHDRLLNGTRVSGVASQFT
jgi:site-specific DNA recombinase